MVSAATMPRKTYCAIELAIGIPWNCASRVIEIGDRPYLNDLLFK